MSLIYLDRIELAALIDRILALGHRLRFRAHGFSMAPFIKDGDILEIGPVDSARVRRGDVVIFRRQDDRLVVHRVVDTPPHKMLITRGDALIFGDTPFPSERVLGRVLAVERDGRRIAFDTLFWRLAACLWIQLRPPRSKLFDTALELKRKVQSALCRISSIKI